MAQQFGAEFDQMQAAATHVEQVNRDVQGQLTALQNQMQSLEAAWRGQAATAFNTLMERWHVEALRLNEALSSIGAQIRESRSTYAQTDEAEQQSYSRISQVLGH